MDPHAALSAWLPTDLYALIRPLLAQRPMPVAELRRQVIAYRQAIDEADRSRAWPDMDTSLGRACASSCLMLLDAVAEDDVEERRRVLHVAVRYFVVAEDDEDDLESLVGFDDDALVINACARALGVEAAVLPLAPR